MKIEDYEFGAFLKSFQSAVLAGYRLNLEDNAKYPQKFGSHMIVTLDHPEPFSTDLINKMDNSPFIAQDTSQVEIAQVDTESKSKVSKRK